MTSLLKFRVMTSFFNVACELSQPMGKTNFLAPPKIEQMLLHRKCLKMVNLVSSIIFLPSGVCVGVLLLNVSGKKLWSCRVGQLTTLFLDILRPARSVNISTLFLGRLRPPRSVNLITLFLGRLIPLRSVNLTTLFWATGQNGPQRSNG